MRIIRVFPRRLSATPDDALAYVGPPDFFAEADEIHVSVSFTWDVPIAERLAKQWEWVAPVKMGGPALGTVGGEFVPGMYLKVGHVITSRGCPNSCWFCEVWKRDGEIRELPIRDGWIIQDDNLLACSEGHIRAVFAMLGRQPEPPQFLGGLEAARLQPWMVDGLRAIHPKQIFFAYDTPDDLEPLVIAGRMLREGGIARTSLRAFVLCGYDGDTIDLAENRMRETWAAGFLPFAMVYRDRHGDKPDRWRAWQRNWTRPAITRALLATKGQGVAARGE